MAICLETTVRENRIWPFAFKPRFGKIEYGRSPWHRHHENNNNLLTEGTKNWENSMTGDGERFSQQLGEVNGSKSKNVTGAGSVNSLTNQKTKSKNDMIPERRRKYLNGNPNNGACDD